MTRKDDVKRAATNAAARLAATVTPDSIVTVDNPMIPSKFGGQLNSFDVTDKRPRLMFIVETFTPEDGSPPQQAMHTLRWNCDPFIAHSIAVDGILDTRKSELAAVSYVQQQMIEQKVASNGHIASVPDDIIPPDYSLSPEDIARAEANAEAFKGNQL